MQENILDYFIRFHRFSKDILRECHFSDFGLNKTQEKALVHIYIHEPISMTAVSRRFGMEKGSFTQVADSLENMGLIRRVRGTGDRRVIFLETTGEGKKQAVFVRKRIDEYLKKRMDILSREEQADMYDCLGRILRYVETIENKSK